MYKSGSGRTSSIFSKTRALYSVVVRFSRALGEARRDEDRIAMAAVNFSKEMSDPDFKAKLGARAFLGFVFYPPS
jgi:hypothetical protein